MKTFYAIVSLLFIVFGCFAQPGWEQIPNFQTGIISSHFLPNGDWHYVGRMLNSQVQIQPITGVIHSNGAMFTYFQSVVPPRAYSARPDGIGEYVMCFSYIGQQQQQRVDSFVTYKYNTSNPYITKVRKFIGRGHLILTCYNYLNQDTGLIVSRDTVFLVRRDNHSVLERWAKSSTVDFETSSTIFRKSKDSYLFFTDGYNTTKLVEYNRATRRWTTLLTGPARDVGPGINQQPIKLHWFDPDSVMAIGFDKVILRGNVRTNNWQVQDLSLSGLNNVSSVAFVGDTILLTCFNYPIGGPANSTDMLFRSTDFARTFVPLGRHPFRYTSHLTSYAGRTIVGNDVHGTAFRTVNLTLLATHAHSHYTPGHPNPTTTSYFIPFAQQDLWDQIGGEQYLEVKLVRADGKQFSHPATISQSGLSLSTSALAPGIYKAHYTIGSKQYSSSFVKQ